MGLSALKRVCMLSRVLSVRWCPVVLRFRVRGLLLNMTGICVLLLLVHLLTTWVHLLSALARKCAALVLS